MTHIIHIEREDITIIEGDIETFEGELVYMFPIAGGEQVAISKADAEEIAATLGELDHGN